MNTISRTCVALSLPLALLWACGDNGDSGNGGTAANGTGANGSGGDLVMGGENSGPGTGGVNNTGGTTSTGGATNTGGLTSLCDGDCICSNGLDDDDDGRSPADRARSGADSIRR